MKLEKTEVRLPTLPNVIFLLVNEKDSARAGGENFFRSEVFKNRSQKISVKSDRKATGWKLLIGRNLSCIWILSELNG